ncbi:MAG: adenine phosphoribosyltransferase [Victivallales bacterium]|nr:adenine phosphoribosyltransferase [Victivallales bacterium]
MSLEDIKNAVREIPDYPKPGILFYDVTPILQYPRLYKETTDIIAQKYINNKMPDKIVGIESRGFIFGMPLAYKLDLGFIPVRKKGKLPYDTYEASYDLEYGSATIEIHKDALQKGDKVVILDDLLATGGTAAATAELVEKCGAEVIAFEFVIELGFLNGREKIEGYNVNSMIRY